MLVNIIIITLVWGYFRLGQKIDMLMYYTDFFATLQGNEFLFFSYCIGVAICILVVSIFLRAIGLYSFMYLLARTSFEAGQLLICFVSIFAVGLWYDHHVFLWNDLGVLAVAPFAIFFASCYSLYLYDFNYPIMGRITNNIILPAASFGFVFGCELLGFSVVPQDLTPPKVK